RQLRDLLNVPLGARLGHHRYWPIRVEHTGDRPGDLVLGFGPDLDDLVVAFVIGDQTAAIVALDALYLFVRAFEDAVLFRGHRDVRDGDGCAGLGGVAESESLDGIEYLGSVFVAVTPNEPR